MTIGMVVPVMLTLLFQKELKSAVDTSCQQFCMSIATERLTRRQTRGGLCRQANKQPDRHAGG